MMAQLNTIDANLQTAAYKLQAAKHSLQATEDSFQAAGVTLKDFERLLEEVNSLTKVLKSATPAPQ